MSDIKKNVQAQNPAPGFDFDKAKKSGETEESIVRRPVIDWPELAGRDNDNKAIVVCGHLIEFHKLNNPKGAERATDYWLAAVILLTHPCPAILNGERIIAEKNTEVYVPMGSEQVDLTKHLEPLLGHNEMFWIAIRPNGVQDVGKGKNPMKVFEVIRGTKGEFAPIKRQGRYLLGGPTSKAPALVEAPANATPAQKNAAAQTVSALNG
jgi:hypothetical protein